MLALKYRPQNWDEFVGNKDVVRDVRAIINNIKTKHVLQDLMFYGQVGVGKNTIAYLIKDELGIDKNFVKFDSKNIDVAVSKIKIYCKLGRNLEEPFKIVFIDDAELLKERDQRELANIIEEYDKTIMFIIATNDVITDKKSSIIVQLKSRCRPFELKPLTSEEMSPRLKEIAKIESIKINDVQLKTIAKSSSGDMREAINRLFEV